MRRIIRCGASKIVVIADQDQNAVDLWLPTGGMPCLSLELPEARRLRKALTEAIAEAENKK